MAEYQTAYLPNKSHKCTTTSIKLFELAETVTNCVHYRQDIKMDQDQLICTASTSPMP